MKEILIAAVVLGVPVGARAQGLEWIEPAVGETATMVAGEPWVVRVRLPTALTPPPGVQQPRALVGWSAELVGRAWPVDPTQPIVPRYVVEVTDVRPDTASSLVYRARLEPPVWMAPGAYALALSTPGGSLRDAGVWVAGGVGSPAGSGAKAPDADAQVRVSHEDGALRISVDATRAEPALVRVGASGRRAVVARGAPVDWYPAGAVLEDDARAVVGVARVSPGTTFLLRHAGAGTRAPRLVLPATPVRAGESVALAVEPLDAGTRVAWAIGGRAAGWGAGPHVHRFGRGGEEPVEAMVVFPEGTTAPLRGRVAVRPGGSGECAVTSNGRAASLVPGFGILILAALFLGRSRRRKIRRRQGFGNRVGADTR